MKKLFLILLLPLFIACSKDEKIEPQKLTGYFLTLKPDCTPRGSAEAKQFEVRKNTYETVISASEAGGYCEVYHQIKDINDNPQEGYLESYYESH